MPHPNDQSEIHNSKTILLAYAAQCRQSAAQWLDLHDRFQLTDPYCAQFSLNRANENLTCAQESEAFAARLGAAQPQSLKH